MKKMIVLSALVLSGFGLTSLAEAKGTVSCSFPLAHSGVAKIGKDKKTATFSYRGISGEPVQIKMRLTRAVQLESLGDDLLGQPVFYAFEGKNIRIN
jgi:hypothetical protein